MPDPQSPAAPPSEPSCGNCVHYFTNPQLTGIGACRRYPPTPRVVEGQPFGSMFPLVEQSIRCGEHRARP